MENAFSRLAKVISLERKQGYRNKAVIGGLDKFASRWETDARADATASADNQAAVNEIVALLIGYPAVADPSARERIIEQILRRLREVSAASAEHAGSPTVRPDAETAHPSPEAGAQSTARPPFKPAAETRPAFRRDERPRGETRRPWPVDRPEARERPQPEGLPGGPVPAAPRPSPVENPPAGSASAQTPPPQAVGAQPPASPTHGPESGEDERQPARSLPARSKPEAASSSPTPPASTNPAPAADTGRPDVPAAAQPDRPMNAEPPSSPTPSWVAPWPDETLPFDDDEEIGPVRDHRRAGSAAAPETWAPQPVMQAQPGRGLDASVTRLPSVGPSFAEKLAKLGVYTVRDLLYLLPRRYDDYSVLRTIDKLRYGEEVTVIATIWQVNTQPIGENRRIVRAVVGDGTGQMEMSFFSPYVEKQLHIGRAFVFSGKIDSFRGRLTMSNPEFEPLEREQVNTARLVPVYPLTAGLSARWLRRVMISAVKEWAASLPDYLPEYVRSRAGLMPLSLAFSQIHFPDSHEALAAAHRRLSFDEFLVLQLAVLGNRQRFRGAAARPLCADEATLAPFINSLPFSMTAAQRRTLAEITADLAAEQPMSRLLQGDVGSGKTAVAAAALWVAVANGTQGAIMAPTEILAEQHARSFQAMLGDLKRPADGRPVRVALFTGRVKKAEREELLAALAAGEIDIAVGTHALIQDEVSFKELTVAVVDEQHRFGVEQRAALRQKGRPPHMLVMSATPIPRSLALTLYGDLDVSVIDEMPAGRTPIRTKWLTSSQRERAYGFIRRQAAEGRQAFIIYPLVENSEMSEAKAAVDEHLRLQRDIFPHLRLGLLHGRLRGDEKDTVMRAFAAHELDVLVATSVVEVGIDVPNATVIMIEGAECFGLAQLHQFRGRVGRGQYASYCILVSDAGEGGSAQRLEALEHNNDGFALAQIDLEMRGPGDFLGTRQSGLPPLHMAELTDLRTLEEARAAAKEIFAVDSELTRPEHRGLASQVADFWNNVADAS
jgi:ATP-dependent DNA helicase RecG